MRSSACACASSSSARAISSSAGSDSSSFMRDTRSRFETASSRCWAPSWRSRPTRRRSWSAASITRARDSVERARLVAPLELGRRAGREDPQRRGVLLARLHRPRVEHREVPEVHAVRGLQADREVALQPEVDRDLGLREALGQRLGERHPRVVGDDRARRAGGVVLERLVDERAVVPARQRRARACRRGPRPRRSAPSSPRTPPRRAARGSAGTRRRPRPPCPRRRRAGARDRGADPGGKVVDTSSIVPPPSGHARGWLLSCTSVRGDDATITRTRDVDP